MMSCNEAGEITARLYVGGYSTAKIYVINPDLEELVTTIDLPAGAQPDWLTLSPDNKKLYCSSAFIDEGFPRVYVVDTETNTYEGKVRVCTDPKGIAFTPDGSKAAVVGSGGFDVALIDTAALTYNNDSSDTIYGFAGSGGIAIHPTINKLYAAGTNGDVGVADVQGGATISNYIPARPSGSLIDVDITSDGTSLYATGHYWISGSADAYLDFNLSQADGSITGESVKETGSYMGSLGRITVRPDDQVVYAPLFSESLVDYFSTADPSTVNEIDVSAHVSGFFGYGPRHMAFSDNSQLGFLLIDDASDDLISDDLIVVIQTSDNSVLGIIDIPECDPRSIVYKP
jgi:DNA-binding beta-propeller fold protein YncE